MSIRYAVPLVALLVAPLFARRRFPFAAPASYWLIATAISFVDGALIPFMVSLFPVGLVAAFLLGNQRDSQAGLGRARDRPRRDHHGRLQHPRPPHRRAHRHPGRFRHQLGRRFCPTRPRAEGGGGRDPRDAGRTRARGGCTRRGSGGAGTDRARAARHRRPRGERDGAPGRRGQASASRRAG